MPIEPIPDLLAELRAGRYAHDFVEAIIGNDAGATLRRHVFANVLSASTAERGHVLTSLLLLGARKALDEVIKDSDGADRNNHQIQRGLERLRDATPKDIDRWGTVDSAFRLEERLA